MAKSSASFCEDTINGQLVKRDNRRKDRQANRQSHGKAETDRQSDRRKERQTANDGTNEKTLKYRHEETIRSRQTNEENRQRHPNKRSRQTDSCKKHTMVERARQGAWETPISSKMAEKRDLRRDRNN